MAAQTVDDLKTAEQLLLLACRRSLPGRAAEPCVELAWRLGCGDALGARSCRVFMQMSRVLDAYARRPLCLQPPHAQLISMPERTLLELVSACQAGAMTLAAALSAWLVRPPHQAALQGTAVALASVMQRAGLRLREPAVFRADLAAGIHGIAD